MPSVIERAENTFYPITRALAGRNIAPDRVLIYPEDTPFDARSALFCIGTFDGVHKGHQKLVQEAHMQAHELGLPLVAVTFNPRPQDILAPGTQPFITTRAASVHYLLQAGVDAVLVQTFTKEFSQLSFGEFLDSLRRAEVAMSALSVGENLRLGHHAEAGVEELAGYAREHNMPFFTSGLYDVSGQPVSSSRTRLAIVAGELISIYSFLGRDFFLTGEVVQGKGEGKQLGFATANLSVPKDSACVPEGVYAGYGLVDNAVYSAAINVGAPKSFAEDIDPNTHFLEAHFLGVDKELYNKTILVAPVEFLREGKAFKSEEELVKTVNKNIQEVAEHIGPSMIVQL